ncbi:MAG: hypothetical protein FJ035_03875 [Chloroflexi bacterium]|nr:hypothetical protein [Chloroflexota bacterium]
MGIGGLTRLGLVAAAAGLMLSLGMVFAASANAQTPPATFYGKGLTAGHKVEASIGGRSCGTATVTATGEWVISVASDNKCQPTAGAAVSFTINGAPATATPAAVWQAGGTPPAANIANGYVLTAGTAATPTAPKTGNAGLLGGDGGAASTWLVAALAAVALVTVAGGRAYARRSR